MILFEWENGDFAMSWTQLKYKREEINAAAKNLLNMIKRLSGITIFGLSIIMLFPL
jgi:hypothetical protein